MKEFILFQISGGDPTDLLSLAGHYADRLSALEQNLKAARRDSSIELMDILINKITNIRAEASQIGFSREQFPGLYR